MWRSKATSPSKLRADKYVEFARVMSNFDHVQKRSNDRIEIAGSDLLTNESLDNDTLYAKSTPRDKELPKIPIRHFRNISVPAKNSSKILESNPKTSAERMPIILEAKDDEVNVDSVDRSSMGHANKSLNLNLFRSKISTYALLNKKNIFDRLSVHRYFFKLLISDLINQTMICVRDNKNLQDFNKNFRRSVNQNLIKQLRNIRKSH